VDIFSLGVTVFEMATDYAANEALWSDIVNEKITYDKVSKELKGVLGLMLCKTPEIRTTAGNCLLINNRLQELAVNDDFIEINDQNPPRTEEMEESTSSSSSLDYPNVIGEKSLIYEPIRRKLF